MTTNQIAIIDGPDRADLYGSFGFGNGIIFQFGDKDVAKFVVQSLEIESGDRRLWNIGVVLVDCSQSKTLKGMSFAKGDRFSGFYTVLNSRRGHLIPKKPVFYFNSDLKYSRLQEIAADNQGSINHLTIAFGVKKIDILISSVVIDGFNHFAFVYGRIDHGDIKDVFGDKLAIHQVVRIAYDPKHFTGFISADI